MEKSKLLYPRSESPSIKINKHKLMIVMKKAAGKSAMKKKRSLKSMSTSLKMIMEFRSVLSVQSTPQLRRKKRNFSSRQENPSTTSKL